MLTNEETLVPEADIDEVSFTILAPGDTIAAPSVDAEVGTVTGDGTAEYVVEGAVNTVSGNYKGKATFTYTEGGHTLTRSVPIEYEVIDPLEAVGPADYDPYVDMAWTYFEDQFDSETGGPWLKDMTMAYFDREKLRSFIDDALLEINTVPPFPTQYTAESFPYSTGGALFSLGLVCSTIRHLMRSYAEIPNPANSPVPYHDRQQYQQRWNAIYQVEYPRFQQLVQAFKMGSFDVGHTSALVSAKGGRLLPGVMGTRALGRYGAF